MYICITFSLCIFTVYRFVQIVLPISLSKFQTNANVLLMALRRRRTALHLLVGSDTQTDLRGLTVSKRFHYVLIASL